MENSPQFVGIVLGFSTAIISTALINFNLSGDSLFHSIAVSSAKTLIFASELSNKIAEILPQLHKNQIQLYCSGPNCPNFAKSLEEELAKHSDKISPDIFHQKVDPFSPWSLIYTSGTTGLPKAAIIPLIRVWATGIGCTLALSLTENDRFYITLPLYHSSGLLLGLMPSLVAGATIILRRKFSARDFWPEIRKHDATVFIHIGELCRYVLNNPPSDQDTNHKIRIIIGNGLRPEVWEPFKRRFRIPAIFEFYASSEGNFSSNILVTGADGVGSIAFFGYLSRKIDPSALTLIKYDLETDTPIRNEQGFCIRCGFGEVGEVIGIIKPGEPLSQFHGYYGNSTATEKKILQNVFEPNDKYYRSGDLLRHDSDGFLYFIDRIGDTFRWKGENVSTLEVSQVLSSFPGILEANVYGVQIPGLEDGRAGMAAIITENIDFAKLGEYVSKRLPSYAVPLFLRILPSMNITGTFKHKKEDLRKEGIDLKKIRDPLFYFESASKSYKPFTTATSDTLLLQAKL